MKNNINRIVISLALYAVLFVVLIIFGTYKVIIGIIVKFRYPDLSMVNMDDYLLVKSYSAPETDLYSVVAMGTFEGSPTLEDVKTLIWDYFLNRGKSKFLHIAVRKFGYWFWKYSPETFDLDYHVIYLPGLKDFSKLITDDEMYELLYKENPNVFAGNRPQWKILFVPNFIRKGDDPLRRRFSLIYCYQHSYADGQSIAETFFRQLGTGNIDIIPRKTHFPNFLLIFKDLWNISYIIDLQTRVRNVPSRKRSLPKHGVSRYHFCTSAPIDLNILRTIRSKTKTSTTSILIAGLRESFRKISETNKDYQFMLQSPITVAENSPYQLYPVTTNNATLNPLLNLPMVSSDYLKQLSEVDETLKTNRTVCPMHVMKVFNSIIPSNTEVTLPDQLATILITSAVGPVNPELAFGKKYPAIEFQSLLPSPADVMICTFSTSEDKLRLNSIINPSVMESRIEAQLFVDTWRQSVIELHHKLNIE